MVLLNKTGKLTLDDNKTNIVLPFEIKDNFKSLKIKFEYSNQCGCSRNAAWCSARS